jgi:hypothetical protein
MQSHQQGYSKISVSEEVYVNGKPAGKRITLIY